MKTIPKQAEEKTLKISVPGGVARAMVQCRAETNDGTQAAGDFLRQEGKTMNRKIDRKPPRNRD